MGGFVAATLALAHPDRVDSLLLSDAVGVASPEPSEVELVIRQGGNPFLLDDVAAFPAFYAMTMARPPFVPRFIRAALAEDFVARRDQLEEIFGDFYGVATLDDRLGEITVPTLVMWGEQDRLVHPSTARVWATGSPAHERSAIPRPDTCRCSRCRGAPRSTTAPSSAGSARGGETEVRRAGAGTQRPTSSGRAAVALAVGGDAP